MLESNNLKKSTYSYSVVGLVASAKVNLETRWPAPSEIPRKWQVRRTRLSHLLQVTFWEVWTGSARRLLSGFPHLSSCSAPAAGHWHGNATGLLFLKYPCLHWSRTALKGGKRKRSLIGGQSQTDGWFGLDFFFPPKAFPNCTHFPPDETVKLKLLPAPYLFGGPLWAQCLHRMCFLMRKQLRTLPGVTYSLRWQQKVSGNEVGLFSKPGSLLNSQNCHGVRGVKLSRTLLPLLASLRGWTKTLTLFPVTCLWSGDEFTSSAASA